MNDNANTLKNILDLIIKKNGWQDQVSLQTIKDNWQLVVGKQIAALTSIDKFHQGVLFINTKSSTWRFELMNRKKTLISDLNARLGANTILDIRININ